MEPVVVEGSTVRFEPLGIDTARIAEIGEAIGVDRSSTVGSGFARFEACQFPWVLSYDETVYVIDGAMTVVSQGRELVAAAGDVMFLPKGSEVEYRIEDRCLLFYATFPVDWGAAQAAAVGGEG